jgi:hypothetical protein
MRLVFTKCDGKYDRLDVVRDDGHTETIACPKQRIIPHDMVHFAVEHTLQERGFLRRVQEGDAATFKMQPEANSDAVERLVEVFQGDAWSGGDSAAADMIDLYRVTCTERACPMLAVTEADIESVRTHMRELTTAWDAVPVSGTLVLQF